MTINYVELFGGLIIQALGSFFVFMGILTFLIRPLRKKFFFRKSSFFFMLIGLLLILLSGRDYIGLPFFFPPNETYGADAHGVAPKALSIGQFFMRLPEIEQVNDIARDTTDVPPPLNREENILIILNLEAKEVIGQTAQGVYYNYWTYNGKVPGPFLRVVEGDTIELTLKNHPSSLHHHSLDLHAVTGPGGGAGFLHVQPGESKTIRFKTLNAGLYVYHCAMSDPAVHMTHGQYGLILVEPKGGLPIVDKEFYLMQGELYSTGSLGDKGLQLFDGNAMLDGHPQYVVFNGRVGGADMEAKVGESVRLFVGNGGVSLSSSFHLIGEIFDKVYPEASLASGSSVLKGVQTTNIPAGGATVVEFGLEVPGKYMLVDHALSRVDRGVMGVLDVRGRENKAIFQGDSLTDIESAHDSYEH